MTTPRKVLNIWVLGTLFLFYFGPLNYNCNKLLSVAYILAFLLMANFFYFLGTHVLIKRPYQRRRENKTLEWIINVSIWYGAIITIACLLESIMHYGFSGFSITNIISTMANTYSFQEDYVFMVSVWVLSYTGWVRIIGLILGSFYWKQLKKHQKILYVCICISIVVRNTLFFGSQKQLIDLAIYAFVPMLMRWLKEEKRIKLWKVLVVIIGFCAACLFLGSVINSRHQLWTELYNANSSTGADSSNWIYKMLPVSVADSIVYLMSYLTQGYRGLALCLTLPFKWAYGVGSSFKIMNDVSRWFSIPLSTLEVSYPVRMQQTYGVGAYACWHTIFPWIASDFTFFGAIIVVSIFIYYWAKAWKEYMVDESWISIVMFVQLTIFVLYIPCNNQLFQTRDSIVATIVIFLLWYLFHGKKRDEVLQEGC